MSKGDRKQKGVKDKSSSTDKIVTSKSGSWIDDLQAKQDAANAPANAESKPVVEVKRTRKAPKYRQSHHTGCSNLKNYVCISKDGGKTAIRVSRAEADMLVKAGSAKYAPRSLWKATTRKDSVETVVESTETQTVDKAPVKAKKGKKSKKS